jgi:arylsulfatase A
MTDDQGWGDMSSHGNTILETPVMDQLAKDGAEFENFYVSPLCAPTRASLLTGRYHLKTGTTSVSNGLEIMDTEETTLAELFRANGYATGIFGKWHNGSHYPNRPKDQGFDEFIGFCAGHWSNYFDTKLDSGNVEIQSTGYITDFLTDRAIDFIDRKKEEPFFCYVPYNAPHSPFQVPDQYFNKYKAKGLDDRLASIYGMVENVDDNIKRLLDKLESEGLDQNTIVIFMTDNGPNGERYNGNMKGIKGHVDEGGVRVPAIIKWPEKINAGQQIKSISAHIIWFPTLKDLCKLNEVDGRKIDGQSLADLLLKNQKFDIDRTLFTHVAFLEKNIKPNPGAIRNDRYRFVLKEKPELYDMLNDPGQQKDISPEMPEQTARFQMQYITWFQDAGKNFEPVKPINVNSDFTELPTYEAQFSGNLTYKEGHGWAHDWLTNWLSTEDEMSWLIKADRDTELMAYLKYTVSEHQKGSTIELSVKNDTINAIISEAFDPEIRNSPDRVKRKEAYEKEWAEVCLGRIVIPAGTQSIKLRASVIANTEVAEAKSIILKSLK